MTGNQAFPTKQEGTGGYYWGLLGVSACFAAASGSEVDLESSDRQSLQEGLERPVRLWKTCLLQEACNTGELTAPCPVMVRSGFEQGVRCADGGAVL